VIDFKDDNLNECKNNIFDISCEDQYLILKKKLTQDEKIVGLGERAYRILKNRHKFTMYNSDPRGYKDSVSNCL
jgi:alpha-glucosidase (family GH31 glycosyl hydrolase)